MPAMVVDDSGESGMRLAQEISSGLSRYLEIGLGRPPGALTPDEARESVVACTGSDDLGLRAGQIAARCDGMLYRDAPPRPDDDPGRLRDDARGLFRELARARRQGNGGPPSTEMFG
jgi:hypothetical protein